MGALRAGPGVILVLGLSLATLAGCPDQRAKRAPAGDEGKVGKPSKDEATPEAPVTLPDDPVLTWYDAQGRPHLAASIEDVPVAARGQVVVSHLGGGAKVALAEEVTVADFREKDPTFSSIDLKGLDPGAPLDGANLLNHQKVLVYSAEWCGFCKKVKAFLVENSVPFTERDIETNPSASRELAAKAMELGVAARGIPVTDIHGALVVGFKPEELKKRLLAVGIVLRPKEKEAPKDPIPGKRPGHP